MVDPLSIAGLIIQLGSVIKVCYDYGKRVRDARQQMIDLCGELGALKSILSDLEAEYDAGSLDCPEGDFNGMLSTARDLVDSIALQLQPKSGVRQRALQAVKFPFEEAAIKETLVKLERLKSWFLLALMSEERSTSRSVQKNLQALTGLVEDEVAKRERLRQVDVTTKLRAVLEPVSPEVYHRRACESWRETGVSSWFLDGPVTDWLGTKNLLQGDRVRVLSGKSGAGKTTLMSQAVERCKEIAADDDRLRIAYFYCSFSHTSSQECCAVLGSWLAQVSVKDDEILRDFVMPSKDAGWVVLNDRIIEVLLKSGSTVLLILDALNESSEVQALLQSIARLTSGAANIRCLISTTPMAHYPTLDHTIVEMSNELVSKDIEAYIKAKITRHKVLQAIPEREFLDALMPHADGMFRWVDSQMNILANQLTPKLVRRALKHLSGDLNATYAGILSRVPKAEAPFVRDALLWLCFSRRLLKLEELCEAVVIDEGDPTIDDSCRISPSDRLIELCRGLVSLDRPTRLVSVAHSSVRNFLTSEEIRSSVAAAFALESFTAQRSIVRKCVTYLQFRDFGRGYCEIDQMHRLQDAFPLLEYCATHWASHAAAIQVQLAESDLALIDSFILTHKFKEQGSNFTFWVGLLIITGRSRRSIVLASEPLYYLASFGLDVCVERLLQKKLVSATPGTDDWHIDAKCGRVWATALYIACARGTIQTVELLLKAGADPNSINSYDKSCLYAASGRRRPDIVRLLMQHGAVEPGYDEESLQYPQLVQWRLVQLAKHAPSTR